MCVDGLKYYAWLLRIDIKNIIFIMRMYGDLWGFISLPMAIFISDGGCYDGLWVF
jgi:hypothetical protein